MSIFNLDFLYYSLGWVALWIILINVPPGSKATFTSYRINFIHGILCSLATFLVLLEYLPSSLATSCTTSFLLIDLCNNFINDFIWKVPSYQSIQNRRVEYFHHFLCMLVGYMSENYGTVLCTFKSNPFVNLMLAELSTPFLMAWRYYKYNYLGAIFSIIFFAVRIVYHGLFFIPKCINSCPPLVGYGFGIPYNVMNIYFLYLIVTKIISKNR